MQLLPVSIVLMRPWLRFAPFDFSMDTSTTRRSGSSRNWLADSLDTLLTGTTTLLCSVTRLQWFQHPIDRILTANAQISRSPSCISATRVYRLFPSQPTGHFSRAHTLIVHTFHSSSRPTHTPSNHSEWPSVSGYSEICSITQDDVELRTTMYCAVHRLQIRELVSE